MTIVLHKKIVKKASKLAVLEPIKVNSWSRKVVASNINMYICNVNVTYLCKTLTCSKTAIFKVFLGSALNLETPCFWAKTTKITKNLQEVNHLMYYEFMRNELKFSQIFLKLWCSPPCFASLVPLRRYFCVDTWFLDFHNFIISITNFNSQ